MEGEPCFCNSSAEITDTGKDSCPMPPRINVPVTTISSTEPPLLCAIAADPISEPRTEPIANESFLLELIDAMKLIPHRVRCTLFNTDRMMQYFY
jgi:hypothetical protein